MSTTEVSEDHLWSSWVAYPDDEQAEGLQRALAEYALIVMENLPADEAGPAVAEALREMGDLPVGEASTSGAPCPRLLPPGAGFMSREAYAARLREAGHQKELQPVQTGKAQHVYHIIANSSE